ncbi:MAG TPA: hypothetical protein PKB10_05060, partial [Tepidisphaeraceae bacterium]|nr:hypothetical protein [Tepidisphaeraceae bacterium]
VNGFKDYVDQNASVIAAELSRVHVFTNSMDGFAQIVIADERGGLWHYAGRRQERDLREGSTLLNSVPTADERKDLLERTQLRHFDGKTWHTATLPLEPQDVGVFTYRPIRSANGIMLDVLRVGPDERSEQIHRTLLVRWQPDSGFTFTPLEPEQAARLAEAERITLADGSVFPAYTGKASILENFEAGHLVLQLRQNDKVLAEKALPGVNQGRVIDKADETFWLATLDGVQPIVVTEDAGMYRIELGALSPWGYPLMPTRSAFVDTVGWLWTEESAERYARMKLPDAPPLPTSLLQGAR